MNKLPDFDIRPDGEISKEFLRKGILTFLQAIEYVKNLRYGRNSNKDDLKIIFAENRGTCSTKHALLKQLAAENDFNNIQLLIGIFRMNTTNTPKVANTLSKANLMYIPEAHCYLKYDGILFDFTLQNSSPENFANDLLFETEIAPGEISEFKIRIHKRFLERWLFENKDIPYTQEQLWEIRELCIGDLSG